MIFGEKFGAKNERPVSGITGSAKKKPQSMTNTMPLIEGALF